MRWVIGFFLPAPKHLINEYVATLNLFDLFGDLVLQNLDMHDDCYANLLQMLELQPSDYFLNHLHYQKLLSPNNALLN